MASLTRNRYTAFTLVLLRLSKTLCVLVAAEMGGGMAEHPRCPRIGPLLGAVAGLPGPAFRGRVHRHIALAARLLPG